jgi:hypothetical protein
MVPEAPDKSASRGAPHDRSHPHGIAVARSIPVTSQ